jgi:hypothetical protein
LRLFFESVKAYVARSQKQPAPPPATQPEMAPEPDVGAGAATPPPGARPATHRHPRAPPGRGGPRGLRGRPAGLPPPGAPARRSRSRIW